MFRFHNTEEIYFELKKQISRAEYSVQLLMDAFEIFLLSDTLLEILTENIQIEIILISNSDKKSLKTVNLLKRLIDGGATIYWHQNEMSFESNLCFGVFDNCILIDRLKSKPSKNAEIEVRSKMSLFQQILAESTKIELLSGEISLHFAADKTIIYKNEEVELNWEVLNAYHVNMAPEPGDIPLKGTLYFSPSKDTKFSISARNKDRLVTKHVFIKVLETKDIKFSVLVFDLVLNEFIELKGSDKQQDHYGVYIDQLVRIQWDFNIIGKLNEISLGTLPLKGNHEFEISKDTTFDFSLFTLDRKQHKKITFYTFTKEDVKIGSSEKQNRSGQTYKAYASFLKTSQRFLKFLHIKKNWRT